MARTLKQNRKQTRVSKAALHSRLAHAKDDAGDYGAAMRHYRAAFKAGDTDVCLNIGYLYDLGRGVARDQNRALDWYLRAYRRGSACAACNIGTVWRDRKKFRRALAWFERAVRMGDSDAELEIGKIQLLHLRQPALAAIHFAKVIRAKEATQGSIQEAKRLLRKARIMKPACQ